MSRSLKTHAAMLTVEKRQYKSPSWVTHGTHSVLVTLTPKRAKIVEGVYRGRIFDRNTGTEICRQDERIGRRYRYSLTFHSQ